MSKIDSIGSVHIFVKDQDRAKKFYTDVLGFALINDAPLFPGSVNRWIAVAPQGAHTELVLLGIDDQSQRFASLIGTMQALTLSTDDAKTLFEDMKAKGIEMEQELDVQPWGTSFTFKDSEGNGLLVVQTPKAAPETASAS